MRRSSAPRCSLSSLSSPSSALLVRLAADTLRLTGAGADGPEVPPQAAQSADTANSFARIFMDKPGGESYYGATARAARDIS